MRTGNGAKGRLEFGAPVGAVTWCRILEAEDELRRDQGKGEAVN